MIKTFEQLGDVLAEFENRLSFIENALPNAPLPLLREDEREKPQLEWTIRQWDALQQLRSEVVGWRQKHAEMMKELDRLNKKPKSKYD